MTLQSPFYIPRYADKIFEAAITRRDSIVLVKGARQTGKTSLLARGLDAARANNIRVVFTDLQKLSSVHWVSTETFYQALAQNIADQLNLEVQPGMVYDAHRGANENFDRFLRREVLGKLSTPLLLALDEVDRLFTVPFSNEVFALFRSWHNERSLDPFGPWERMTLAIAYATEAHLFITDINQSPFNVGTRLTLEDFAFSEVEDLHRRLNAPLSENDLKRFYALLGGSPYLIHRGLHQIITYKMNFDSFLAQAPQDTGCFGDHLKRLAFALQYDAGLCGVVRGLLEGQPCPDPQSYFRLRSSGVLLGESPENAYFRCPLYQTYLKAHL